MNRRHIVLFALTMTIASGSVGQRVAHAQGGASAVGASAGIAASGQLETRQSKRAQRKAERKANRARKNAELMELEKHGYNPAREQTGAPHELNNAHQQMNAPKQGATPASSP